MTVIVQILWVLFISTVAKCYPVNKPLFDIEVLPTRRGGRSPFSIDTPPSRMPFLFPPLSQRSWSEDFVEDVQLDFPRLSIPSSSFQQAIDAAEKSGTKPQEIFTAVKLQQSSSPIASYDDKSVNTQYINDTEDDTSAENGFFFIKDVNLNNDTNFAVPLANKSPVEVTEQKPIEKLEQAKISVVLKTDDKSKSIDPDSIIFPEDVYEERNDDIEAKVNGTKSEDKTVEATLYTNINSMKENESQLNNNDEIFKITVPATINDRVNKSVYQVKATSADLHGVIANNPVLTYIKQEVHFYLLPHNSLQVQKLPPLSNLYNIPTLTSTMIQSNIVYNLLNMANQLTFNDTGNQADNRLPSNNNV